MRSIIDRSTELTSSIQAVANSAEHISKQDVRTMLNMLATMAEGLHAEIEEMDYLNRLHEFYLARSEHLEGLNVEVD